MATKLTKALKREIEVNGAFVQEPSKFAGERARGLGVERIRVVERDPDFRRVGDDETNARVARQLQNGVPRIVRRERAVHR